MGFTNDRMVPILHRTACDLLAPPSSLCWTLLTFGIHNLVVAKNVNSKCLIWKDAPLHGFIYSTIGLGSLVQGLFDMPVSRVYIGHFGMRLH